MPIAALFDIHGNLPALEAVLDDVRSAGVDRIVIGGDVIPGPMPRETLERLMTLELPMQCIHGNCELTVLAQMAAFQGGPVTYWGTTSGKPLSEPDLGIMRWTAEQLWLDYREVFSRWPKTLRLEIDGLGQVLFCHGTPRSETEIVLCTTPEERILPLYDGLGASLVVCGHTHMQFDRTIGATRVINAGSVGAPFGEPGAYWALLGPDVQLRRTTYDFEQAAERTRATPYPKAQEAAEAILHPPAENAMRERFAKAEVGAG